jgi:lipoate-protein ligase B
MENGMNVHVLGCVDYAIAQNLMNVLHNQIVENPTHPGLLLVLEHPPVVTLGKRALMEDVLTNTNGVSTHITDRGGRATAHEPGQVVIYPIVSLRKYGHGVRTFVRALEAAMQKVCADYGLEVTFDPKNPGVWLGNENLEVEKRRAQKLGAVGIRVSQGVSCHGLAFNVSNSLETFQGIVPCGLNDVGVTTLHRALEQAHLAMLKERVKGMLKQPTWFEVAQKLADATIHFIEKGPQDVL